MKPACPECGHVFARQDRGRLFGGHPWSPRVSPCPTCGLRLRWPLWAWRLQTLAALLFLPALFRNLPDALRGGFAVAALFLIAVAIMNLRLHPDPDGN